MDHRPFEDWLLNEEQLTPRQQGDLNTHLQACPSCSALAEVNLAFRSVRQADPAPQFASRFQLRLTAQRQALRRRNRVGYLVLTAGVLALLVGLSWPLLSLFFDSPVSALTSWLSSLVGLWASFQALLRSASVLFTVAPRFVPAYIWAALLFGFAGWSIVWVLSLMKFTKLPQGA